MQCAKQTDRRHHRRGDDDRRWREDDRHGRDRHWHDRSYDGRWDDHRRWREPPRGSYYDRDRDSRHWYRDRHGWSPYDRRVHRWKRGARLPPPYLTGRYVLRDYGYYRLRPPPRGAHWVRVGPDLVLASIATGIVIDVLHGYFR